MDIIIGLILLVIALYLIFWGAVIFVAGMAYGYWAISIVMAPVLWILMIAGAVIGLICTLRNAVRAFRTMRRKGRS